MSATVPHAIRAKGLMMLLAAAVAVVPLSGCSNGSASRSGGNIAVVESQIPTEGAPVPCGVVKPPATGAYIGLYRPPSPYDMSPLDSYMATTSPKPPAILMWYQPWAESGPSRFDQAMVVSVLRRGAVPMITWEPWDPGTDANFVEAPSIAPKWRLRNILQGDYDDYIKSWARAVRGVRGPVMIRPMHEMNGRWYPWAGTSNGNTPREFVAAWRYIHDMFEAEGATNVTWVWSINWDSVPSTAENRFSAYYPGDKYVDWTSISGFNWGTTNVPISQWLTFDEVYDKPLAYLRTVKKPIVLAEFGSVEQGGDKAAWITDAYTRIRQHHEVKAVVYFDSLEVRPKNTQDWRIHSSPASAEAYRKAVAPPSFGAAPSDTLARWVEGLSRQNQIYLRSLPAVY